MIGSRPDKRCNRLRPSWSDKIAETQSGMRVIAAEIADMISQDKEIINMNKNRKSIRN